MHWVNESQHYQNVLATHREVWRAVSLSFYLAADSFRPQPCFISPRSLDMTRNPRSHLIVSNFIMVGTFFRIQQVSDRSNTGVFSDPASIFHILIKTVCSFIQVRGPFAVRPRCRLDSFVNKSILLIPVFFFFSFMDNWHANPLFQMLIFRRFSVMVYLSRWTVTADGDGVVYTVVACD